MTPCLRLVCPAGVADRVNLGKESSSSFLTITQWSCSAPEALWKLPESIPGLCPAPLRCLVLYQWTTTSSLFHVYISTCLYFFFVFFITLSRCQEAKNLSRAQLCCCFIMHFSGLIPSSRDSWPTACRALKPDTGGILHIHENFQVCFCLTYIVRYRYRYRFFRADLFACFFVKKERRRSCFHFFATKK